MTAFLEEDLWIKVRLCWNRNSDYKGFDALPGGMDTQFEVFGYWTGIQLSLR
jgi:hypothetical protein